MLAQVPLAEAEPSAASAEPMQVRAEMELAAD
jgi:hypothetical protein